MNSKVIKIVSWK